jgi:hypothetical protein
MAIFSFFKSDDIDAFAKTLAADIAKRYPPRMDHEREQSGKVSVERVTRILEGAYDKAIEFQKQTSLGLYRKARLLNTFKWSLKELGYTGVFVDLATEGLVVYLSRGRSKA